MCPSGVFGGSVLASGRYQSVQHAGLTLGSTWGHSGRRLRRMLAPTWDQRSIKMGALKIYVIQLGHSRCRLGVHLVCHSCTYCVQDYTQMCIRTCMCTYNILCLPLSPYFLQFLQHVILNKNFSAVLNLYTLIKIHSNGGESRNAESGLLLTKSVIPDNCCSYITGPMLRYVALRCGGVGLLCL